MIGKRIQRLRQQMGLSISELADRAGIAKSYLSTIERDIQGNPSIHVLEKLCSVLHVSLPEILQDSSDEPSAKSAPLDAEWMEIVRQAMNSGVTKEQFRDFLEFQIWRSGQQDKDQNK
jgi:XRE family transcriptional regulator, master regulator for biofilm formation